MRDTTKAALNARFEARIGSYDGGHAMTMTRVEVEDFIRRVERETREDVYADVGVEPAEVVLSLSLAQAKALAHAGVLAIDEMHQLQFLKALPLDAWRVTQSVVSSLLEAIEKIDHAVGTKEGQ